MTYYFAEPLKIRGQEERYEYISNELQNAFERVESTAQKLSKITGRYPGLKKNLSNCVTNISTLKLQADSLYKSLRILATKYEKTEKNLVDIFSQQVHTEESKGEEQLYKKTPMGEKAETDDDRSISWLKGNLEGSTEIGGVGLAGALSGELLGASYDIKNGAKFEWDEDKNGKWNIDEIGVNYSVSGEAHVAKGSATGNIGYLSGTVNGTVGEVSAKGGIGANLFKDGKLSPQLYAELGGKVVGAKGDAEVAFGSENTNAHVKGEGELGVAEAEISGQLGRISYKKEDGTVENTYGVKGIAGAEAYAASGEVSGGITIFGIDIDVGISGKLGGAGAKVGGYATTGGVNGSLSLGLGAGVGLDVSIDWSNFKFGW